MYEDWRGLTDNISKPLEQLRAAAPEVMASFGSMARAAGKSNALDAKSKELVALGISVAVRCDACIAFHAAAAARKGATRAEIAETIGMAIYMGAGPSVMDAAQALEAFDQFSSESGVPGD